MDDSERLTGMLLGGALGDAVGSAYEGRAAAEIPPSPTAAFDHHLPVFTDDTQMTLATCEALLACEGRVDPEAIAQRFLDCFRQGELTRLGASTMKALRDLDAGGHWALVGRKGEFSAGNGAAMRIAPLAFFLDPHDDADRRTIRDVCRITHHNEEAYAGALAVVVAICRIRRGDRPAAGWLAVVAEQIPDSVTRDRLRELSSLPALPLIEIAERYGCSGYVADTVPLALAAAARVAEDNMPSVLDELVRCGGDTDTVASIFSQIAGAFLGVRPLLFHLDSRIAKLAAKLGQFIK